MRAGRLLLLLLLARWTWLFLVWPMRQDVVGASFLHVISIPFHEAGHIFFAPLGDLMTSLGGSLAQVIVPIACGIAFAKALHQRDADAGPGANLFGIAVMVWWAGENLLDVAIYINDARSLTLVLLGGHTGAEVEGHDWEHILQLTGLSVYDHRIAWTVHVIGALTMLVALAWGTAVALRSEEREEALVR